MATPATPCSILQQSLEWCQGSPEYAGIRSRIYYLAKSAIVSFPQLPRDARGRATGSTLAGDFVLAADAKWRCIDILPDKSQLTSETQGEIPSQTQLNKLTAVHPGVGPAASALAAWVNNTDSVFVVQDITGNFRVLGNDRWPVKATVAQDNGQGAAGTTSTTLSIEATDEVPAPYYVGTLATEQGDIDCAPAAAAAE